MTHGAARSPNRRGAARPRRSRDSRGSSWHAAVLTIFEGRAAGYGWGFKRNAPEVETALFMGAISGLGRATTIALARAGAGVAPVARGADELEETGEEYLVSWTWRVGVSL
jgi:hypothetical protein